MCKTCIWLWTFQTGSNVVLSYSDLHKLVYIVQGGWECQILWMKNVDLSLSKKWLINLYLVQGWEHQILWTKNMDLENFYQKWWIWKFSLSGHQSSSHPTIHPFPYISSLMPVTHCHHQTGVDTSPVSQAGHPKHSSPRKVPEGYEASLIFPKRWSETQKKRHVEAKGKEKETLKTKAMKTMVAKKVLKEMVCVPKWVDQHSLLLITGWFWRSWCR